MITPRKFSIYKKYHGDSDGLTKPAADKNMSAENNLTGKWMGTIIYGKGYREMADQELYFDLDMIQHENEIAGTAVDVGGIGVSSDTANILGTFRNNKIFFLKQYESLHYVSQGQIVIDRTKRGPQIEYSGIFDPATGVFYGKWQLKLKFKLLGFIPIPFGGNGTWTMRRK